MCKGAAAPSAKIKIEFFISQVPMSSKRRTMPADLGKTFVKMYNSHRNLTEEIQLDNGEKHKLQFTSTTRNGMGDHARHTC